MRISSYGSGRLVWYIRVMGWPLYDALKSGEGKAPLDLFLETVFEKNLELYPAQEEAILELYSGKNVVLNTPTGSGKSLVASALHFLSLASGKRSIYTCPIKALVNEKFLALCQDFGPDQVGMITGDATVNPDAPIICCTAEILSNLALRLGDATPYADIIMDEFHYYSDRDRGVAWQIPLLTLKGARFLLMSATLGDTSFFEKTLTELNGLPTTLVRSRDRPVPLDFEYSERPLHLKIQELVASNRTPIYMVNFTQRDCAEEAQKLMSVDFSTKEEKKKIADFLIDTSFRSPYGKEIQKILKHGIGLHHAGLLPRYRVLVEKLAQRGLLKIICGTDTLGVGVNVPIRTVLFTKLCKYDGQKTTILSVRDFQQISGRAGRKGFDDRGTVVVQAPEHVIENITQEAKAAGDPKKAKKLVKRKPPEKGFLPWTKEALAKLSEGQPEPLVSRFQVTHAMVLNVLARENTVNCNALRDIIRRSHETPVQRRRLGKHAWALFRSLHDRKIIELNPLRVNVDLQQDFSLNQALSLYLIDTIHLLDRESPTYALDLLTLVESILESPEMILRRQVDRLKTVKMGEMKSAGIEFDERIAELEKIEHPKPNREFIYDTFNAFAANHPWVGQENIRPKSIAREMFETFQSFADYIREYDLERIEGLLLRYLSEVYKVLIQTVPDAAQTDEVVSLIEYFGEMLRGIDSSLVEEWEKLRDPLRAEAIRIAGREEEARADAARLAEEARRREEKAKLVAARNEVFRAIRLLWNLDYVGAAELLGTTASEVETRMKEYQVDHTGILTDTSARSPHHAKLEATGETTFTVSQTIIDPDGHNDWALVVTGEWIPGGKPKLQYVSLGAIA
jgi:superfamily II RNA helicase